MFSLVRGMLGELHDGNLIFLHYYSLIIIQRMGFPKNPQSCPTSTTPFDQKKLLKNGCFKNDVETCSEIMSHLSINANRPGASSKDIDNAKAALDAIAANTYMTREQGDETLYNTNECVIPMGVLQELKINNCRVGDVQLGQTNMPDQDIYWTEPGGCVIPEDVLRSRMPEILDHITKTYDEINQKTMSQIDQGINDNRSAKELSERNKATYDNNAANQRGAASNARSRTRDLNNTRSQQVTEMNRAADNATHLGNLSAHNQTVIDNMFRNCRSRTRNYYDAGHCGWHWKCYVREADPNHTAVNGGTPCPTPHSWCQHEWRSCCWWQWVGWRLEWRWNWWHGWQLQWIWRGWEIRCN